MAFTSTAFNYGMGPDSGTQQIMRDSLDSPLGGVLGLPGGGRKQRPLTAQTSDPVQQNPAIATPAPAPEPSPGYGRSWGSGAYAGYTGINTAPVTPPAPSPSGAGYEAYTTGDHNANLDAMAADQQKWNQAYNETKFRLADLPLTQAQIGYYAAQAATATMNAHTQQQQVTNQNQQASNTLAFQQQQDAARNRITQDSYAQQFTTAQNQINAQAVQDEANRQNQLEMARMQNQVEMARIQLMGSAAYSGRGFSSGSFSRA